MASDQQRETGVVEIDGDRLRYDVAGQGHPLVLIHGGLVDRRLWDQQVDAFAQRYRVIRYDLRGFGDSASPTTAYAHYQDLHGLLAYLGIERSYLLGLSLGGRVALDATLAYPHLVDGLILVSSGLEGFPFSELMVEKGAAIQAAFQQGDLAGGVELMTQLWTDGPGRRPDQVDPAARQWVKEMTLGMIRRSREVAPPGELEPPAIARLAEIHTPTLVIVGDQDVPDSQAIAERLAHEIRGARKVVLAGTAHHLNLERPAEFNRIVLDFLSGIEPHPPTMPNR